MKILNLALASALAFIYQSPAEAETFKCTVNGKTTYQAKPCAHASTEKKLNIKLSDPVKNAKALERLKEIEAHNAADKENQEKKAKEELEKNMGIPNINEQRR